MRFLKRAAWLVFLGAGLSAAQAFSLLGPINEAYQVHDLGYALTCPSVDLGAPKNIGEDYRRTTPVMYYAFDETFLDYFGTNGVAAVDQAFAIFNNLTNVSSYSADLSEIPLEATRFNQTAGALNLLDLKTSVVYLMMEQLGLADPIRFAWCLHNRLVPGTCPFGNEYMVTMRNLGIVPSRLDQLQYSEDINGQLYSYYINDFCDNVPTCAPLSQAVSFPVDIAENADRYAPVASGFFPIGGFYTSLTRDDVAGLRYLLRSGNVHWEDNPFTSTVYVTNNAPINLQLMVTSNLNMLITASFTNDDATLLGLYPGLAIVPGSTIPSFTNVVTTNLSIYFTNGPFDPFGTPPHIVYSTNYTTNVTLVYKRAFANVVTNSFSTRGYVSVIDTSLYYSPTAPVGSAPQTITTTRTMLTNMVTGDFYILPSAGCGLQILSNVLTTVVGVTNIVAVNNTPSTNAGSGTYLLSRAYVDWFTNHSLAYFPVVCSTNEPGLRRGVEKLTFVKTTYDSLLGRFYAPQTNYFTMTTVTNSTNWVQTYQRVVTQPDFLFTASDMAPGPSADTWADWTRNVNFSSNNVLSGLAGPGTIEPPTRITFNKVGPIFLNMVTTNGGYFLDQKTADRRYMWGSFDDSTNAPVVYPNGTSIAALESQMLMQVTSTTLPPGKVRVAYNTQLTGTGGSGPPYTWSLAPNSPALPLGLVLSSSGRLLGAPAASGVSCFYVRMADTHGGFTVWQVTLTVLP